MKYPFADTPMNRKLESLIDQCSDPSMIVTREMGRWIFHALPHAEISESKKGDEWDIDINYKSAHVFVIDKETGAFGMEQLRDDRFYRQGASPEAVDVKSVLDAIKNDDLSTIVRICPRLVNLDMGNEREELTYLDHYQEMLAKRNPSKLAYNLHIDWLAENGHLEAGGVEAPAEIAHVVNQSLESWAGPRTSEGKPAGWNRTLTRYASYESVPSISLREFRGDSLVRVEGLVRDEELRREMKDVKYMMGEAKNPYHQPEIMLDLPDDEYYAGRDKLYESLFSSYEQTCEMYTEAFLNGYRSVLTERYLARRGDVSEDHVHEMVDVILHHMRKDVTYAKLLISDSPQEVRNKLQLLDMFDGNKDVFRGFLKDKKIKEGIETGKPMKEVLDHLPLLKTSKKAINHFLSNFHSYLSYGGQPVDFMTEKGPCVLTRIPPVVASVFGSDLHSAIALSSTLPEKHLIGEDRDASSMMEMLAGFPELIETLSHRLLAVRKGEKDTKNLMSWLPKATEGMEKRRQTLNDAETMFKEKYYSTVVHHLMYINKLEAGEDTHEVSHQSVVLKGGRIVDSITKGGEYRDILSFDDAIHRDINQLFKMGKPDANIEWGRTIDEDFEFNGYTIRPITNNAELSQEGAELNHCVGTYLNAILDNESYIFSVTKDGHRVSTIEIKESFGGDEDFEIIQHYAYGNTTPLEGAIEAAEDFLDAINEQDISFNREPCDPDLIDQSFEEGMEVEREEVEFGLRFSDRDFVLHTLDSMQRILPSFDVWDALEKEGVPGNHIEDLRRDYEMDYGTERSLEKASPPGG